MKQLTEVVQEEDKNRTFLYVPLSPPCVPVFLLFGRHSPPDTSPLSLYPSTRPLTVHARSLAPDAPSLPPSLPTASPVCDRISKIWAAVLSFRRSTQRRHGNWRVNLSCGIMQTSATSLGDIRCVCVSRSLSFSSLSLLSRSLSLFPLSCMLTREVSCRLQMRADTRCNSENYS